MQAKKYSVKVTNLVTGKVHRTYRIATSKRAAVEDYAVAYLATALQSTIFDKKLYRIDCELVGSISAPAITGKKNTAQVVAKADEIVTRAARRRADKAAAAARRAAKAAKEA